MTSRQIMGTNLKLSIKFKGWMEGTHTFRGLKVIESYFLEVVSKSKPLFW
jgi:hypothetical protein